MSEAQTQTRPAVLGGVIPYLEVDGAAKAAEFYKTAFAATEVDRVPGAADGRLIHCHLYIHGQSVMLSDPFPESGHPHVPPAGFMLHLQVTDIHAWFNRAKDAGAAVILPVEKQFWGDLYGQLKDPFGVIWTMAQTPKM